MLEFQNIYNLINNDTLCLLEDITQPFIDDIELANYNLLNEKLVQVDISDSEENQIDILSNKINEISDALKNKNKNKNETKINEFYKKLKIDLKNDFFYEQIINTEINDMLEKLEENPKNIRKILKIIKGILQKEADKLKNKLRKSINNKIPVSSNIKYIVAPQSCIYPVDTGKELVNQQDCLLSALSNKSQFPVDTNPVAHIIGNTSNISSYAFISFVGKSTKRNISTDINNFNTLLTSYNTEVLEVDIDDDISYIDAFKPTIDKLINVINFADKYKTKNFVINCLEGKSRSYTLAYLLKHYISSNDNVFQIAKSSTFNLPIALCFLGALIDNTKGKKYTYATLKNYLTSLVGDETIKTPSFNNFKNIFYEIYKKIEKLENVPGSNPTRQDLCLSYIKNIFDDITNEIYTSLNHYIASPVRGARKYLKPNFAIPNETKFQAGARRSGADNAIYGIMSMNKNTYKNIINNAAKICNNSKNIFDISKQHIIMTVKSDTQKLFSDFLNALAVRGLIGANAKIVSYADTKKLFDTKYLKPKILRRVEVVKDSSYPKIEKKKIKDQIIVKKLHLFKEDILKFF